MSSSFHNLCTPLRCALLALAAAQIAVEAEAAEQRASLVVTSGISASSNPFLSTDGQAGAMLAEVTVNPVLTSKSERFAVTLSGNVGHRRYSNGYGSDVFGNASLSGVLRESERLQLQGSVQYRQEISTDIIDDTAAALDPKSIRKSWMASSSATWRLSEYDSLAPELRFEDVAFDRSEELDRYQRISGSLGYNRRLSPYTSIGVRGGAMRFAYRDQPDATILSGTFVLQHKFSPLIEFDGALGLERADFGDTSDSGAGKLSISGNAQLCRRGETVRLCARSAMSTEPSGLGAVERRFTSGLSYERQLGEFSRLSLGVSYSRTTALNSDQIDNLEYVQADAGFNKRLNKFLTLDTFVKYRRRSGTQTADAAQAGFNLRFSVGRN